MTLMLVSASIANRAQRRIAPAPSAATGLAHWDQGEITAASASEAHVQAAANSIGPGGIVRVPSGSPTWGALELGGVAVLPSDGATVNVTVAGANLFTKHASYRTMLRGLNLSKTGGGNSSFAFLTQGGWKTAKPVLVEECTITISNSAFFEPQVAGGMIVAKCSITGGLDDSWFKPKKPGDTESWLADDTFGTRDTNGEWNLYIEDCLTYGMGNQGIDADDAARIVLRYTRLNYGSFNSHGLDTSETGLRHFEIYHNQFRHSSVGDGQSAAAIANVNQVIWLRGATGVIFNNYLDDYAGGWWGNKPEGKMDVRAAQDNSGATYGYFTDGRAKYSAGSGSYPRQRQIGQNWSLALSNAVGINGGVGDYFTDPIRVWGNTGPGSNGNGGLLQMVSGDSWGTTPGGILTAGVDYTNDGTQRAGYSPFTYPHPLRTSTGAAF